MGIAGCAAPGPSASSEPPACTADLPMRTSPIEYPVAVLHVAGDDLPPVVGEIDWQGGEEPVATTPPRPIHLSQFTVLQTQGRPEVSIRMTDGVELTAWTVDAIPADTFRSGDLESGRVRWEDGSGTTAAVCVPITDGDWAIEARLTFADGAGRGTYYWRLNVRDAPSS